MIWWIGAGIVFLFIWALCRGGDCDPERYDDPAWVKRGEEV